MASVEVPVLAHNNYVNYVNILSTWETTLENL
jgi:hypothetical protein